MKLFFKSVLQQAAAQILAGVLLMGFVFLGFAIIIGKFAVTEIDIQKKSVLVLNLNANITDTPAQYGPQDLMLEAMQGGGNQSLHLYKILENINAAAEDSKIRSLFLHGNLIAIEGGSGYAALREIRDAIKKFKNTGKPVYAYTLTPNLRTYYLVSCADHLMMNPFGDITLNGLSSEVTFYHGAMEKFGIGVQPIRVGKYKSAIEPFTRKKFSEEGREQIQELLDDRWTSIINEISENRMLEPHVLNKILENSFHFKPAQALKAGLIDKISTRQQLVEQLVKIGVEDKESGSFRQIGLVEYGESQSIDKQMRSKKDKIAVVYVEGTIVEGESFPGYTGSSTIQRVLSKLKKREDVKAVILRVNSPGGSATASEIMQQAIRAFQESGRPLVVSMGALAASGGYWISAPAQQIFAQPETITGSIGVFGLLLNMEGLGEKVGLTWDRVSSGQQINPFTISRPKSDEELEFVQKMVDDIYDTFISNVANHRNLEKQEVHEIAQGRVWSGSKALDIGLVDSLGGLGQAIETAGDLAGLDIYEIEHHPKEMTGIELLAEVLGKDLVKVRTRSLAETQLSQIQHQIINLRAWNDPRNAYVRLPFRLP
ncbi:MAG: signal peptide peptidase SppA [Opitutae bacterium]|jgi:protease IV|nr:signal peptide peptidase SppA [Opitutae bacterium]